MLLQIKTDDPLGVLKSSKLILDTAKHVSLVEQKIENITQIIKNQLAKGLDAPEEGFGITGNYEKDAQLAFIEDSVNFCFWAEKDKPKWTVEWPKGNIVTGGWYCLKSCFERAITQKVPILDSKYLSNISLEACKRLFKGTGETEIPLIKERWQILNETGRILTVKFDGQAINLVKKSQNDAIKLVKLISNNFPSFRDVPFYKRAQIFANDISYFSPMKLKKLNLLTAFADYKIPQMLRTFGVVKYTRNLAKKIDNYILIPKGSRQELEIRSAAVWGVELIRQNMNKYRASEIDNALWLVSQELSKETKPYHRTYTTFY